MVKFSDSLGIGNQLADGYQLLAVSKDQAGGRRPIDEQSSINNDR